MANKAPKRPSIVASTVDGSPVVEIFGFKFKDADLVMDCKALGSMTMDVVVTPEAIAKGWTVVKQNKKALFSFAKQIPKTLRKAKKDSASTTNG